MPGKLDCHRRDLLTLQGKNEELQYQIEDLVNRSPCSNIRIKGVSSQAVTGKLEDFMECLFRYVAPDLKDQNVVIDRTHRVGRPARSPVQAQDILICLHHYKQRETKMAQAQDQPLIDFEGFHVVQIDLRGHRLTVANIYGPNEHQEGFLRDALGRIMGTPDKDIVGGGDFNIVSDTLLDRSAQQHILSGAFSKDFKDWLAFPPHAPIAKCWRLNTRLLAYKGIIAETEVAITQYLEANDTPEVRAATLWEALKAVIRGQFIAMAARLNNARWTKWQQLEDEIRTLEATHSQSGSLATQRQIATLRKQLRALDDDRAEYALLQTKQKYYTGAIGAGRLLGHCLRAQQVG
ncbi:hypothetical protein NDU88_008054 [Pleurodeles waltl]|uniref:Endonuclease/exonuclease/phosphatase domain-containing protein n=1 Tax=Pleurodeles waltl TaxID=8319 RepID=A0AAV7P3W5_PLEWA|nr:hypothetical protein NDU88_008054 [Pleurodeles waltl]